MSDITKLKIINAYDIESLLDVLNNVQNGDIRKEEEIRLLLEVKGVSINSKPRKDGRWQGILNTNDTIKYFYGISREEVISKIQQALNDTKITKTKKVINSYTLHNWLDKWFGLYKAKLKPLTIEDLNKIIKEIKIMLPDKPISKLQGLEIQEALEKISTDYKRKRVFARLSECLDKAEQLELIKRNPCFGVETPKYIQKKKRALTLIEQARLIQNLEGHKYEALYYLMLTTGIRVGEALALTKDDITTEFVSINKNVVFVNKERIVQDTTKTAAGERNVILPISAYEKLKPLLITNSSSIFQSENSKYVSKVFSNLCKSIDINNCSLHSLRHTYSTRISEAGIPPKVRQYLLGHANLEVTENIYTDTQSAFILSQKDAILSVFDINLTQKPTQNLS